MNLVNLFSNVAANYTRRYTEYVASLERHILRQPLQPLVEIVAQGRAEQGPQRTAEHEAEGTPDQFSPPAQILSSHLDSTRSGHAPAMLSLPPATTPTTCHAGIPRPETKLPNAV